MTVFTKPLTEPEVIAHLKKEGQVLLEVQMTSYYILRHPAEQPLEDLLYDWFVRYKSASHAYRDGCRVGGGDTVTSVKDLTNGKTIPFPAQSKDRRGVNDQRHLAARAKPRGGRKQHHA